LIERDAADGADFESALIVQQDDGVSASAGQYPIAHVHSDPRRRANRDAGSLNLYLS
jgi:hypothetical protein